MAEQPFAFTNQEVAGKFEFLGEHDQVVHIPAGRNYGSGWKGPLSQITPAAAAKYVAQGGNLLREKAINQTPIVKETPES